jgi:hypothetical protein
MRGLAADRPTVREYKKARFLADNIPEDPKSRYSLFYFPTWPEEVDRTAPHWDPVNPANPQEKLDMTKEIEEGLTALKLLRMSSGRLFKVEQRVEPSPPQAAGQMRDKTRNGVGELHFPWESAFTTDLTPPMSSDDIPIRPWRAQDAEEAENWHKELCKELVNPPPFSNTPVLPEAPDVDMEPTSEEDSVSRKRESPSTERSDPAKRLAAREANTA